MEKNGEKHQSNLFEIFKVELFDGEKWVRANDFESEQSNVYAYSVATVNQKLFLFGGYTDPTTVMQGELNGIHNIQWTKGNNRKLCCYNKTDLLYFIGSAMKRKKTKGLGHSRLPKLKSPNQ